MAAGECDTVPLLDDSESVFYGLKDETNKLEASKYKWDDAVSTSKPSDSPSGDKIADSRCIVCVFVAAFDIRKGNIIEWFMPDFMDVEGIEFKALASGSHKMRKDFTYFKKGNLYGLSCFEHIAVDSVAERGSRMKSVGVLAPSYKHLYEYIPFLEEQVRYLLGNSGNYNPLVEFYEKNKGVIRTAEELLHSQSTTFNSPQHCRVAHISGCFSQFVKFFNVNTIILWKFALLKKRLLILSPPPAGAICYRVHCCNLMASHKFPGISTKLNNPIFYVGLNDTETMETLSPYIACTTENILSEKPQIYDLFIDNQNLKANIPLHKELMVPSIADKRKYDELIEIYKEQQSYDLGLTDDEDEEAIFSNFFSNLNTKLFQALAELSYNSGKELTADIVTELGFDPVGDKQFIIELVETYGFDVTIAIDKSCCACANS